MPAGSTGSGERITFSLFNQRRNQRSVTRAGSHDVRVPKSTTRSGSCGRAFAAREQESLDFVHARAYCPDARKEKTTVIRLPIFENRVDCLP